MTTGKLIKKQLHTLRARYAGKAEPRIRRYSRSLGLSLNGRAVRIRIKYINLPLWAEQLSRVVVLLMIAVLAFTVVIPPINARLAEKNYALTTGESALLPKADTVLQKDISYDTKSAAYSFQQNSKLPSTQAGTGAVTSDNTMIKATIPTDSTKGVTVNDPINSVDFKATPTFSLAAAQQSASHIFYPFSDGSGQLVYSPQATDMLEDLVLRVKHGNSQHFDYKLDLGSNLAARVQSDGSVNVYGSSLSTLGNISTDNTGDAARLQKAQVKAPKTNLLFSIPVPTIRETGHHASIAKAHYSLLKGNILRITATNLNKASYPLDIDPTVTVQSVSQLYRDTNGESNVDFNSTDGSINRGDVTGGIFDDTTGWTTNSAHLASSHFDGSAAVSNGYIYEGGGASGTNTANLSTLEYAQISTPAAIPPATGATGSWASASLPAALSQYHLLSYNGYLYVLGGSTTNTGCAARTANTYYNPTQPNGAIASSWTASTAMPAALCSFGATIYNNTIYVIGGQSASGAAHGVSTVYYASILPNGAIGSWNTSAVNLPVSLYGADVQVYGGYIYVIGGYSNAATTVTLSTIYRAALSSDGSIYGSGSGNWTSLPNTFSAADGAVGISNAGGGDFTAVNDGYMYVSGGCTALTSATQTCTGPNGTTYIAQINADGTLGPWSKIASSNTDTEVGGSLLVFGNYLYDVAGCSVMNAASFTCNSTGSNLLTQVYAPILGYGQIGPVANSDALPRTLFEESAVVANGYLYIIGGCITITCEASSGQNTSDAVYWAPITTSGDIGAWTTSTHTINHSATAANTGLAAAGVAVYDNFIYLFGGYNHNTDPKSVWSAPIGPSGDVTANFAAFATALTTALYSSAVFADRGFVYSIGGCNAAAASFGCSTYITTTYRLTVGTGGITAMTSGVGVAPTLPTTRVGAACTSIYTAFPNDCFPGTAAMGVALYNGYVYLAGGASTGNGQSVIVFYGKISATGTIGAWADATNYLPTAIRRTAAAAYNGYLYVIGGHDGDTNATQQTVDIGKIDLSNGNLDDATGVFASSSQLAFKEWDGSVVSANGTIFEAGGCTVGNPPTTCTTIGSGIQTFQVYNADNGGTATWSDDSSGLYTASADSVGASSVAYNGYLYTAGGCHTFTLSTYNCTSVNNTATTSNFYAPLNPDGSVGTWTAGPTLSGGTAFGCMTQANGYLYYIGGQTGASTTGQSAVYYSKIGANGVPGAWSTLSNALPTALTQIGCDSFDGVIYVTGGLANVTYKNTTYYLVPSTSTGNSPGAWSTFTPTFTTARAGTSTVAAGGYLYVIGGYNGATYDNDVQYISINPTTGAPIAASWSSTRSLPYPIANSAIVVANGYIFVSGGNYGTTLGILGTNTCSNNTYIAPILSTGETGDWTQGVADYTTNGVGSDPRMGPTAAYADGYYYVIGGYDCTSTGAVVSSNIIQYGGEQSQDMSAFFTRYADLGGDASPELFLSFVTNAQINSTDIEDWKMSYITSTQEANSWGIATTISPLTSGVVTNVFAYDGTGTQVYLNRYTQLAFTISMTKSFTFPDTTQPSVNSYYLYYSPAPQTRLRNGKDFQDEQQQGLDLNY